MQEKIIGKITQDYPTAEAASKARLRHRFSPDL
jgi:hypothetical protein